MSKSTIDTFFTEQLVLKATSLEDAIRIRVQLVLRTAAYWYFLYSDSFEIFATTEIGGKLSEERLAELKTLALEIEKEKFS